MLIWLGDEWTVQNLEHEILSKVFHQLFADLLLQNPCGVKKARSVRVWGSVLTRGCSIPQGALAANPQILTVPPCEIVAKKDS